MSQCFSAASPLHREVLECFRREELLDWSEFQGQYGPGLREGSPDHVATPIFRPGDERGERQWEDFRKRVIEHVRGVCIAVTVCGCVYYR